MDIDEGNGLFRDKEMYLGQKKYKTTTISRNESNTVRRNQIENKYLRDKIQNIELENNFNHKSLVQSCMLTEKSFEKIKVSTGKFKPEYSCCGSVDSGELTDGK